MGHPKSGERIVIEITKTYSAREVLWKKDFADLSLEEIEAVKKMMRQLTLRLGERRTRRKRPGNGHSIDLRRTLRKSYSYGGEVLIWARREPKFKPRPLVIIADISGSMERYTRLLLHFIYGLAQSLNQPVEAFRLQHPADTHHPPAAEPGYRPGLDRMFRRSSRIGQEAPARENRSKDFNFNWGRRVLGRGAVVLFISDGWDRGDMDLLGARNGAPAAQLLPADLAQPAARLAVLRTAHPRHASGAALYETISYPSTTLPAWKTWPAT